jgi:hypothetical protein
MEKLKGISNMYIIKINANTLLLLRNLEVSRTRFPSTENIIIVKVYSHIHLVSGFSDEY